jgi:hypothetical protein
MDWGLIVGQLLVALIPLVGAALTAAISYGAACLRERYRWAREARTVDAVETSARDTVLSLQQTVVDELRTAAEDGKLTAAEKVEIKRLALEKLTEKITDGQQAVLGAITADVTGWLSDLIERMLVEHKLDVAAASGGVPINPTPE